MAQDVDQRLPLQSSNESDTVLYSTHEMLGKETRILSPEAVSLRCCKIKNLLSYGSGEPRPSREV